MLNSILEHISDMVDLYYNYTMPIFIGATSALIVCFAFSVVQRRWPSDEEAQRAMTKARREKWLRDYLSWCITEAFEEAVFLRKISRQEADYYYDLIGRRCRFHYLIPKFHNNFPNEEKLKETIRKRIRGKLPIRKVVGKPKISLAILRKP